MSRDWQKDMSMCKEATRGPWKVYDDPSGRFCDRGIGTEYEHPQLHGPEPIVTIANAKDGPYIYIGKCDAELIAEAREALPYWLQQYAEVRDDAVSLRDREQKLKEARPIEEWHEDYGSVLWWAFPIEEPPYCGTPLDLDWPDYHTHWTPIVVPERNEEA